jgi:hypothetical protein
MAENAPAPAAQPVEVTDAEQNGAKRVYHVRVREPEILRSMEERLAALAGSLRLPGFRPGKIPGAVLEERYGGAARAEVLKQLAGGIAERGLPEGSLAFQCELRGGAPSHSRRPNFPISRVRTSPKQLSNGWFRRRATYRRKPRLFFESG